MMTPFLPIGQTCAPFSGILLMLLKMLRLWPDFLHFCEQAEQQPVLSIDPYSEDETVSSILANADLPLILTLNSEKSINPVAEYRSLATYVSQLGLHSLIWIRNDEPSRLFPDDDLFSGRSLDSSILTGSLLCDGIGDLVSVENAGELDRNRALAYNLLQGARARISKTEFVACPSCGRTLFDLQSTTKKSKKPQVILRALPLR